MMHIILLLALIQDPALEDILGKISREALKANVEKLASFNTRNTYTEDGAKAAEWIKHQLKGILWINREGQVEVIDISATGTYTLPGTAKVRFSTISQQGLVSLPSEEVESCLGVSRQASSPAGNPPA